MQKIISVEKREKKESRNKMVIGLILVLLMLFSTAGYAFFSGSSEKTEKIKYNGIEFVLENNFWNFKVQGYNFLTKYNPEETENIFFSGFRTLNNYANNPLFFSESGNYAAKQEIVRNLQNFVSRIQDTCVAGKECENQKLPIKNCSEENIILFEESEIIEIKQEENCVFILAPSQEQVRASDAFLFKILGIKGLY